MYWGGLLAPAAELLPGEAARSGVVGVWSVAVGCLAAGIGGLLFGKLAGEDGEAAGGILACGGKWLGRGLLFLYIMWGGLLVTVRLTACARRLTGGGPQDGAAWFYLLVLGSVVLWMGAGRLGRLGRTGEVMLAGLLVTGGVVLVLGCSQMRRINLLPGENWSGTDILPGIRVFGYGLLWGFLARSEALKGNSRRWIGWNLVGWGVLGVAQTVLLGCFGGKLMGRMDVPFFRLAKSIGIKGGFQRVESVVAAIWVFSDLLLLGYVLWVTGSLFAVVFPKVSHRGGCLITVLTAMTVGMAALGEKLSLTLTEEYVLPIGGVLLGIVIPGVLLGVKRVGNTGSCSG